MSEKGNQLAFDFADMITVRVFELSGGKFEAWISDGWYRGRGDTQKEAVDRCVEAYEKECRAPFVGFNRA